MSSTSLRLPRRFLLSILLATPLLAAGESKFELELAAAKRQPEGEKRMLAIVELADKAFKDYRRDATAFLEKTLITSEESGSSEALFMVAFLGEWGRKSPKEAATWARGLPDGFKKSTALQLACLDWAGQSGKEAADFFLAIPPGADSGAPKLFGRSPREDTLRGILVSWVGFKDEKVSEIDQWIPTIQDPSSRELAIKAFITAFSRSAPALAAKWSEKTKVSSFQLEMIARDWLRKDAAAARKWISESDKLAPEVKEKLLQTPK